MRIIISTLLLSLGLSLAPPVLATELPGDSIYQIGSKWVDQDAKQLLLNDLQGKPTLLAMVYLSCEYLCPTIISEVRAIEAQLDPKVRAETRVVLVSFDPTKDTPQAMNAYAKKRKIDKGRWTLLTNNDETKIRELAASLNFKYQKTKGGEFTHSFLIVALNEAGVPVARIDAANQDHQPMIDVLGKLLPQKPSPK